MLGNRLKELRKDKLLSIVDLGNMVGKSKSTISRYENNLVEKLDLDLVESLAEVLDSSSAYLLGMTDDPYYRRSFKTTQKISERQLQNILVTNEDLAPDIPEDAWIQIRPLKEKEDLSIGNYYYIEFNNQKAFRMVVHDHVDGIGFLPMNLSEQRIAYDLNYVKILGKAISMKVYFDDE